MSEAKATVKDVADMPMGKEEFNDNKRKYEPIDCERNDTISEIGDLPVQVATKVELKAIIEKVRWELAMACFRVKTSSTLGLSDRIATALSERFIIIKRKVDKNE